MKMHYPYLLKSLISGAVILSLTGCSDLLSSKMPSGSVSMEQAYKEAINGTSDRGDNNSLEHIRKKIQGFTHYVSNSNTYTHGQEHTINREFQRLPNPNIEMYVYPHEVGSGYNITPVPGYSTVFPLYQHVYYAISR